MANNSMRLRSLLKSPNSPRRHHHNVSFEDQHNTSSLELSKSLNSTIFSGGHSHSLQVSPDSISFLNGSSLDEVTYPDIDDLLPKTDYTYARTVSYRKRCLNKNRSVSPNMSRRRIDGNPPTIFISDDEDGYEEEEYDDDAVISKPRNFYGHQDLYRQDALDNHSNEKVKRRSALRHNDYASTPATPHDMHSISVHDHYYKGMVLRSGSHVKGADRQSRLRLRESSSGSDAFSQGALEALVPTYRSDYEERESRTRNRNRDSSNRIIKTTTTTTTFHTYEDEDEQGGKKMLDTVDDEEMKLKLDESQSEKNRTEVPYVLHNLDGLDVEEDISDVEDFETKARSSYSGVDTRSQHSNQNFFTTFITTIITTIVTTTTTAAESVWSGAGPVLSTVAMPVTVPASWMWRAIVTSCSWILRESATILLVEMESKHRRRRGCCLWFLPFLLLLPLALLAGHYASHMTHHVGSFVSESEATISSMWVGLWSERERHIPVVVPPLPQSVVSNVERQEVDMTQINYNIQQTILQMFSERQQEIPPGLTSDQVKEIVQAMLAAQVGSSRMEIDSHITSISGVLKEDIAHLNGKLLALQSQIHESDRATQLFAGNLDETKASFQSMSNEQRAEWLLASQMLESKFLDLRNDVNAMTNQNAALVAMLKSCCQNNTALAASIRGHMVSILSEMGSDDHDSALSGLMAWMQANYVERGELDRKLSSVAAEITDNLKSAMAERIAAEVKNNENMEVKASIVSASIDVNAVKSIVEEALVQFSADRVGIPDFALESAGGSVLSVRCSETYYRKTALVSVFGIPLWYTSNSPRAVIQPSVHPGECWAFKGSSGFVVIQLSQPIQPTGFTLEHIPRSLSPTGDIDSAPKSFSAIGLKSESDTEGINLGNYTYLDNGKPIQHFPVQNRHPGVHQYIEMRVLSNHGNPEYTCIYRFRVHGLP